MRPPDADDDDDPSTTAAVATCSCCWSPAVALIELTPQHKLRLIMLFSWGFCHRSERPLLPFSLEIHPTCTCGSILGAQSSDAIVAELLLQKFSLKKSVETSRRAKANSFINKLQLQQTCSKSTYNTLNSNLNFEQFDLQTVTTLLYWMNFNINKEKSSLI